MNYVVLPEGVTIIEPLISGGVRLGRLVDSDEWSLNRRLLLIHCEYHSPALFSDPDALIPGHWLGEEAKTDDVSFVAY